MLDHVDMKLSKCKGFKHLSCWISLSVVCRMHVTWPDMAAVEGVHFRCEPQKVFAVIAASVRNMFTAGFSKQLGYLKSPWTGRDYWINICRVFRVACKGYLCVHVHASSRWEQRVHFYSRNLDPSCSRVSLKVRFRWWKTRTCSRDDQRMFYNKQSLADV